MHMKWTPKLVTIRALSAICMVSTVTQAAQPIPIGSSTTTFSYETAQGDVSFSGIRDFNGTGPGSATDLAGADNIRTFNSVNAFGRRTVVDTTHPEAIGPDESLISHAFFKINNDADYFPGLITNGNLTITIDDIRFPEPVTVDTNTILLHVFTFPTQADKLIPSAEVYENVHNHHLGSLLFRDIGAFEATLFRTTTTGIDDYVLGDIQLIVTGNGTTTLSVSLTFPYVILKNLEQNTQTAPPPLPAPQGFLEPFHFHLEYVVAKASCAETVIDSDGDNDVDLNDYATFQRCLSGPQ